MIPLMLGTVGGPLRLLCLGAHPDDIEIGCGGTLLTLAAAYELAVDYVLLTGTDDRKGEARAAGSAFLSGADVSYHLFSLPDGRLPEHWGALKQTLESLAASLARPDLILAPRTDDAHQDHRLLSEMVTTVWRDSLVLRYEIPKWDGDLGPVSHYVPLDATTMSRKIELLNSCFASQLGRDWWDDELFRGLMRIRGMEVRATYAEAYVITKAIIG